MCWAKLQSFMASSTYDFFLSTYSANIFSWKHRGEAIFFNQNLLWCETWATGKSGPQSKWEQARFISAKVRDHALFKVTDCPTVKSGTSHLVSTTRSIWKSDSCGVACVTRFADWVLEIHSKLVDWTQNVLVRCRRNMWMFDKTSSKLTFPMAPWQWSSTPIAARRRNMEKCAWKKQRRMNNAGTIKTIKTICVRFD